MESRYRNPSPSSSTPDVVQFTLTRRSASPETLIGQVNRDLATGMRKTGREAGKVGVKAFKAATPKSFGKYPLKFKVKKTTATPTKVHVEFQASPVGFWAMLESGAKPHQIARCQFAHRSPPAKSRWQYACPRERDGFPSRESGTTLACNRAKRNCGSSLFPERTSLQIAFIISRIFFIVSLWRLSIPDMTSSMPPKMSRNSRFSPGYCPNASFSKSSLT